MDTDIYYPRHRDDDEISLISMCELAPSPIPDDDIFYASSSLSPTPPTGSAHFSPHGGTPPTSTRRSLTHWLTRTQRYSSYAFLGFLATHATTTAITPLLLGTSSGNSSLLLARTYLYAPTPFVEVLLIPTSLAVHIASGISLRLYRYYQQKYRYGGVAPISLSTFRWRNFSGVARTGWIAAPLVTAHALLLRYVPYSVDGDSSQVGLEYAAWGFWGYGRIGRVVGGTFYAALVGTVSWHVVFGLGEYWKISARRRKHLVGATVAMAAVWAAGLSRVVVQGRVGGYIGRHYARLYAAFFGGFRVYRGNL